MLRRLRTRLAADQGYALIAVLAFVFLAGSTTADARRRKKKGRKVADKEHKEKKAPEAD